jgi:hypothetical protein
VQELAVGEEADLFEESFDADIDDALTDDAEGHRFRHLYLCMEI